MSANDTKTHIGDQQLAGQTTVVGGWPGIGRPEALRGRSRECALLDDVISTVCRGESRSLILRGEAGIGKTALLEHLINSAATMTVAHAAGVESEMELAFAGLHQLCKPLLKHLERIPPPQHQALETVFGMGAGPPPDRFLVGLAFLSLLSEAAEERSLLCVVDDTQWLDQASALTLAFVARRPQAEPVGMVLASREQEDQFEHVSVLRVSGLSDSDARALLRSAVPFKLDERVRDRIIAETGGNPLALLELPEGLTAAELAGGFGVLRPESLTVRIEESFARRLDGLHEDARRLLLIAAADPVGDPVLLWSAADRLSVGRAGADELATHGLLDISERVTFRHPLVRSAIYRSACGSERRAAHRALAEVTAPATDPDRRAWHLGAAAAGPDEDVALELETSAVRARERGGLAAAAAFLRRALALTADPGRRADRALAAAEASLDAGLFDVAKGLVATAETGPLDQLQRARVELLLGRVALFSAPGGVAPQLLMGAARRFECVDLTLARDIYLDAWGGALYAGRLGGANPLLEVSRAAKAAARDESAQHPADLLLSGLATLITDGPAAAAVLLEQLTRTFAEEGVPRESLKWGWMTVIPTYVLWDEASALAICGQQIEILREVGALARLPFDLKTFNLVAARCGDFAGAEEAAAQAEVVAEATGSDSANSGAITLSVFRGREAEARSLIELGLKEALRLKQGIELQRTYWMLAMLCNSLGRYGEAVAAAQQASTDNPEELFISAWAACELLEAASRSDQPEVARTAFERILVTTAVASTDSARGIEARSRALISEGAAADRMYREAIKRLRCSPLRPELARAHLLYGEWLRRESRRVDAREQLRAAYEQLSTIGMEAFAERARIELFATGEKVRKRTYDTRDQLTPQELQIAQMASKGLSNREIGTRLFLSPRTVEYHLSKVYPKLDIKSRAELAAWLRGSRSLSLGSGVGLRQDLAQGSPGHPAINDLEQEAPREGHTESNC
jgi:DNA-binding CsgD family transcriptional regulator/tetratricopeptide (TPR) repeat protein